MSDPAGLSRRERQIMDVIYAAGQATATDVLAGLADAPSRAAIRTFLRILEEKGHLQHHKVGREFVYRPTHPRSAAGRSALQRLLAVFFEGSIEKAVAAHLASPGTKLTQQEISGLTRLIAQARQRKDRR